MGKLGGTYILLFVFISFFSFVSFAFAEEASLQEMLRTVRRAGEEVRALQFQTQRVLGPMIPPDEMSIFSTLRFGMRGEEVRALQELLRRDREIYPEGLVTGYFGVLTDNAVKRFQAVQGLEITGIVDSWTRAYLRGFSRIAPPFLASQDGALDLVVLPSESVPEVQDAILVDVGEAQATSTVSTSTVAISTSTVSSASSGGSGGGGSPTVQSSGGSGGSSPAPSMPSDISEPVAISTTLVTTSTSVSVVTSTVVSLSTSTPVISTSTDLAGSVSESSTTVSVVSSTVVLDDVDNDNDDDYDMNDDDDNNTDKKAEKRLEKEGKKDNNNDDDNDISVFKNIKVEIKEIVLPVAKVLEGTSTALRADGAFGNLATILNSLSGLLGRMSSFFR